MSNPWENPGTDPGSVEPGQEQKKGEQEKTPIPSMPKVYKTGAWYVFVPLVIKLVVSMVVSMAAAGIYSFFYMSNHYDEAVGAMQNQDAMTDMTLTITEQLMQYTTLLEGISALLVIPIMLFLFHRDRKNEKFLGIVPNKKASLWQYAGVIGISAVLCVGVNNLIIIGNLQSMSASYQQTTDALYSASLPVQVICLGLLVPAAEELVFRGVMFRRMRQRAGFIRSAVSASLIFAVIHGNMVQMIYAFFMGMVLCYLYEKYGSVKAPVLGHMVMNLVSIAATETAAYEWMMQQPMRIGIITVVCAAAASSIFLLIQRIDEKPVQPSV